MNWKDKYSNWSEKKNNDWIETQEKPTILYLMGEKKGKEMQKPHQKSLFDVGCHLFLAKVRVKIKVTLWCQNKSQNQNQSKKSKSLFDVGCQLLLVKVRVKIKARMKFKWIDKKKRVKGATQFNIFFFCKQRAYFPPRYT